MYQPLLGVFLTLDKHYIILFFRILNIWTFTSLKKMKETKHLSFVWYLNLKNKRAPTTLSFLPTSIRMIEGFCVHDLLLDNIKVHRKFGISDICIDLICISFSIFFFIKSEVIKCEQWVLSVIWLNYMLVTNLSCYNFCCPIHIVLVIL